MIQEAPLTGDYVRTHGLPPDPDPDSYNELRDAINGLLADAAAWLDANGPAVFLDLGEVWLKQVHPCCVGKHLVTDICRIDSFPSVGWEHHIPCFMTVETNPQEPLTREYVQAHALPEDPDPDSYRELREAINAVIRHTADWLDENGPAEFLYLGRIVLRARPPCCVGMRCVLDIGRRETFPVMGRTGHVPC